MVGIVDTVYPNGSPVNKADVRSFAKNHNILVLPSADVASGTDLSLQLVIMLKDTGRLYRLKSDDVVTVPDGVTFIRDANGVGFEIVLVQGFDGGAIFIQDTEPPVGDNIGGSIWIDSSSGMLDLYTLSGDPPEWVDTGLHLKGANGTDGGSALSVVRVVATANVNISSGLENGDTIDGVTLVTNDLVLLVGQTAPAQNGVYLVPASGAASRSASFDTFNEHPGCYFSVMEGVSGAGLLYRCSSVKGGTLGSTALTFVVKSERSYGIDFRDFAVAGGGIIDYTSQIQAAIDATPTGGLLSAPIGVYNYTTLSFDSMIGKRFAGIGGAINSTILRCIDTTGNGGVKVRSTFDLSFEYLHFDHSSAAFYGYLIDASHAPGSLIDTQGLFLKRCTLASQGYNKFTAKGMNLNQATLVTLDTCKLGSLFRPIDGQAAAGGSYSNGIRFKNCQSFDNVGYFANYLGEQWSFEDCNFQACHDGAQRIAYSDSSTPFLALSFLNCGVYDAVAAGTSYLNLGPGEILRISAGMWGGRRDLGASTLLSATGAIHGLNMQTKCSLFTNVLVAAASGNKGWAYNEGNVFKSCTNIVVNSGNVSGLSGNDLNAIT